MLPATKSDPEPPDRWELIRDVLVFQLKLVLDAFRDVVLFPVSLAAGVADLFLGRDRPRPLFYQVLALGKRTEVWINLFGNAPAPARLKQESPRVDDLVDHLEKLVVDQYERGGVTAQAKDAIDRGLDAVGRRLPR